MPNILKRIAVSALFACVLVLGLQPAVALSQDRNNAEAGVFQTVKTTKKAKDKKSVKSNDALCREANDVRKKVIKQFGKRQPGRDICKFGIRDGKKAPKHRKADYLATLERMIAPPPAPAPAAPATASAASSSTVPSGGSLDSIAQCESGGDPAAVSPDGTYRGKYQFDYQTWQSVGGSGDPAAAPESEQDMRAALLMQQRGNSPWPVCGN